MRWLPGVRLLATAVAILTICQLLDLPPGTSVHCLPLSQNSNSSSSSVQPVNQQTTDGSHLPSDLENPLLKRQVRLAAPEDKDGDGKPDGEAPEAAAEDPNLEPPDEEKKEAVDEDLKSDEEKDDDDDDDDDDGKSTNKESK